MKLVRPLCAIAVACCCAAPTAHAQQLITWTDSSHWVDPAKVPFNSPPPGVPDRPKALRVDVLLPDGYDGERRFPVLYLLHGHGDSYDAWVNPRRGDLLNIARGFPGIIVMPEAATGWYTNWWNASARGNPAWERYHLDELIPEVESRLRILPGRQTHAIAGLSMGGGGAAFYAEQRPGYFGAAASFSGSISIQRPEWPSGFDIQGENHSDVYGDPTAQEFYWRGHNPTALVGNLRYTRLYVTVGDGTTTIPSELTNYNGAIAEVELRQQAQDFANAAQGNGEEITYVPRDGVHDWPYWRQHLAAAIQWGFFKPVTERPTSWTYQTVAQHSVAWDLRIDFTDPPGVLEKFTRSGDTLRGEGVGTVHVQQDGGDEFIATLPFTRRLAPRPAGTGSQPGAGGGGSGAQPPRCPGRRSRRGRRVRHKRRAHTAAVRRHKRSRRNPCTTRRPRARRHRAARRHSAR